MRLEDYVARVGLQVFATRIGKKPDTVRRWILPTGRRSVREPSPAMARKIHKASGGRVTPNDLYLPERCDAGR